ncbi:MAG: SecDF P1 head subdomain-containing protein [Acidimicrobiia bacterium]
MRRPALLLLCALAVPIACGDDGGGAGGSKEAAAVFALRPVLEESEPPCSGEGSGEGVDVMPERRNGKLAACLTLGPAIVDANDVRSASLGVLESGGKSVGVTLGRTGSANLDGFAARSIGKRLALMINGRVHRAPNVQSPRFYGRIEVVGLPDDEATALFEDLRQRQSPS